MYIYSDIVQNVYEIKNTFCKERILHEYRRVNSLNNLSCKRRNTL